MSHVPPPCRLLAVDLDGTLLDARGKVDPRDRLAVRQLAAAGIEVVLASGRMPDEVLPWLRELDLHGPSICADGAVVVAADGQPLVRQALDVVARSWVLGMAKSRPELAPLFLVHQAPGPPSAEIHGLAQHSARALWLSGWAHLFRSQPDLAATLDPDLPVLAAFLVADPGTFDPETTSIQLPGVVIDVMSLGDGPSAPETLRIRHLQADKARALAAIAQTRRLEAAAVATVGDWYNDISMLRWAARSFAMGHAPGPVAAAAKSQLRATDRSGGGLAEVAAALLGRTTG